MKKKVSYNINTVENILTVNVIDGESVDLLEIPLFDVVVEAIDDKEFYKKIFGKYRNE